MKHIFISHAGPDAQIAERLENDLRNSGHETRVDKRELNLGDNSIDFMNSSIADAHTVLILYSKHTPRASWQKLEIDSSVWNEVAQSGGTCIVLRLDKTRIPPLLGPKVYGFLDVTDPDTYKKTLEDICKAVLPDKTASSVVSEAFGPESRNPFRRIRAEYFEDRPDLLAKAFAPPEAFKTGALEEMTPCFLEGSRGTGKSMLLLSLRARNYLSRKTLTGSNESDIFGFYLKLTRGAVCNAGVLPNVEGDPELVLQRDAIQITDVFSQEIILCLLESLFSEIASCIRSKLLPCDELSEKSLVEAAHALIYGASEIKPRKIEDLSDSMAETHRQLADFIRRKFIYGEAPSVPIATLDLELLKRVIALVKKSIPNLSKTMCVALLDEYETLFPYQQRVVNSFVKHGAPDFSIKIAKKFGTGDISGTTTGQDLQEIHDYTRLVLVYDVEDKAQLRVYHQLLTHITENILKGEKFTFTSMGDLLPVDSTDELTSTDLIPVVARLCKVTTEEFMEWPQDKQREKMTYYGEAAIYRVLYGARGRHRDKRFSGFHQLALLSSGVIRYFQEFLGVAYYLAYSETPPTGGAVVLPSDMQSKAVHIVSQHNLTTLSRNVECIGEALKYFLLDLGDCLREKLLTHTSEPEAARLTIEDPESLDHNEFALLKQIFTVGTREGVFQTKEGRPAFKPRHSSDPQPSEFNVCRVYAPVLQISPRLRWRTPVSCNDLLRLLIPKQRPKAKKQLMTQLAKPKVRTKHQQRRLL